jgi:hypothetical protein
MEWDRWDPDQLQDGDTAPAVVDTVWEGIRVGVLGFGRLLVTALLCLAGVCFGKSSVRMFFKNRKVSWKNSSN